MRQGNAKEALAEFSEALRLKPDYHLAQENLKLISGQTTN
jgi:hypothetical protein